MTPWGINAANVPHCVRLPSVRLAPPDQPACGRFVASPAYLQHIDPAGSSSAPAKCCVVYWDATEEQLAAAVVAAAYIRLDLHVCAQRDDRTGSHSVAGMP